MAIWGLVARTPARLRPVDARHVGKHVWIYVALFAAILPVVVVASYTRPFLATYPFYKYAPRSWTDFFAWELMYGASFLALEFFFRGFLLVHAQAQMGAYAIFVMIVPYCMIHFHKPVAEVCGAIFAGIVLGTLAMATRSIWCGVLIHVSVAWTMDCLALCTRPAFPARAASSASTSPKERMSGDDRHRRDDRRRASRGGSSTTGYPRKLGRLRLGAARAALILSPRTQLLDLLGQIVDLGRELLQIVVRGEVERAAHADR